MLYDEDRGARIEDRVDEPDQFGDFAIDQAGANFVEQNHARLERQRACDFESLAPKQRQRARRQSGDVGKSGAGKQRLAFVAGSRCADEGSNRVLRDFEVLLHRHVEERARDLVGAPDAGARALGCRQAGYVTADQLDRACTGHDGAADQPDQRRFSCAVGTDHAGDGAGPQLEIDVIDGDKPAVAFDEAVGLEQRLRVHGGHAGIRRDRGSFAARPTTPCGANRISTIRITPVIAICSSG